ncbi:MAG: nucleotidyl transferase AbiEii/AbiGii toxin family protein [Acidobacteriota bacterium]
MIQQNLLKEFGKLRDASFFYLTGGTALAEFYLGHRRSFDLDFFTSEKDLIIPFSRIVEENLSMQEYSFNIIRRFESFVELEVNREGEKIRLHLAYDSPFRFEEPHLSSLGVNVNDYKDLIVDKVLTFFGRWQQRDAVDLYFILQTRPIEELITIAKQKDPGFDLYWFSMALKEVDAFPDDIEKWPVDMLVKLDAGELKSRFLNLARDMMYKIKEENKDGKV